MEGEHISIHDIQHDYKKEQKERIDPRDMYPKHYIDSYNDHQLGEQQKRISKTADGTSRNPRSQMKNVNKQVSAT